MAILNTDHQSVEDVVHGKDLLGTDEQQVDRVRQAGVLQGETSVETSRVDGLVHVSQEKGEEYEEPEHGEDDPEDHLEGSHQKLASVEETPGSLLQVSVLSLQQSPLLLQPVQLTLLKPGHSPLLISALYLRNAPLNLLDLVLHGRSLCPRPVAGSDEAAGEAGEAVARVEDQEDDSHQVESVKQEQKQVLTPVRLQLIKEPLELLPICGVRRRHTVEGQKYPEHDENAEHKHRDQGELDRVADLLSDGGLHIILIQTWVQAVVEIVWGNHQEGQEEDDGINRVVSIPDNSKVSQIIFNLEDKKLTEWNS